MAVKATEYVKVTVIIERAEGARTEYEFPHVRDLNESWQRDGWGDWAALRFAFTGTSVQLTRDDKYMIFRARKPAPRDTIPGVY